ncbi:MAG: hypothetical protein UX09_C0013G0005 [Candidatus Uhrbacteria bacterium GW2011_GWE2_45_35]|uniref:Uncharacterized protein n=1 Tax=Candidatus Uhrbacteria bacterium GW2011_GWE2_45_35 TaxID=1618993 RepID=A0A0G1MKZ7_9BACT|nr:MAG: hypothetical protein UX09_C0013G0005 [Candidatus Uhrbacteria bacterium GW2011_GWE2_45_35]
MKNSGEQFLHQKVPSLHTSKPVEHEVVRRRRNDQEASQKPADKLADWLKVLEKTHMGHREDPRVFERIKDFYRKQNVTITLGDIPKSYWNNKAEIMIRQGYGGDLAKSGVQKQVWADENNQEHTDYLFPDEMKEQELAVIISNQKRSLDAWLDYLTSPDALYPTWAKYWSFTSMLKMGKYEKVEAKDEDEDENKVRARFQRRTKTTTSSFPLLNPRALAKTIGVMAAYVEEKTKPKDQRQPAANVSKRLSDQEFQRLLSAEKFSDLYAQFLLEIPEYSTEGLKETRGQWRKFPQGSKPDELVKSLGGYPLEWCTADPDTARTQLQGGDFYVYYSFNEDGQPVIPRLAIRMEGKNKIAESPRGIAPNQNLDPYIHKVLDEKLVEFGVEGEKYKKRLANMERLTFLWENKKQKSANELLIEDLRFLYEFDSKIEGFGYEKDPRIQEVLAGRDPKDDLSTVIRCSRDQISTTKEEALRGEIRYHYGNLNLSGLTTAEGLTLPETIGGYLDLIGLTTAEGLALPETIGGSLDLRCLTTAEGLTLPETIGGYLDLRCLTTAEVTLPETIGGDLNLSGLTTAEGLTLPETIGGSLNLRGLTTAEGLTLPKTIGGYLDLIGLTTAEGLTLPETIGGYLYLSGLTTAEGPAVLPQLKV